MNMTQIAQDTQGKKPYTDEVMEAIAEFPNTKKGWNGHNLAKFASDALTYKIKTMPEYYVGHLVQLDVEYLLGIRRIDGQNVLGSRFGVHPKVGFFELDARQVYTTVELAYEEHFTASSESELADEYDQTELIYSDGVMEAIAKFPDGEKSWNRHKIDELASKALCIYIKACPKFTSHLLSLTVTCILGVRKINNKWVLRDRFAASGVLIAHKPHRQKPSKPIEVFYDLNYPEDIVINWNDELPAWRA